MIKTFEQYHELDPYGEENWDDGEYKIMKYHIGEPPQMGYRYCLIFEDFNLVRDFNNLEHTRTSLGLQNLNEIDKELLKSGEYFITNGCIWGNDYCQKITFEELKKKVNVEL